MSGRTIKREKKVVRATVAELMQGEIPTATLAIINRYRVKAMVAWGCFGGAVITIIAAILFKGVFI